MALIFPLGAVVGAVATLAVYLKWGPTDRGMLIALPCAAVSIGCGVVCAFHVGLFA